MAVSPEEAVGILAIVLAVGAAGYLGGLRAFGSAIGVTNRLQIFRQYAPIPSSSGEVRPLKWLMLEGDRLAVTVVLLGMVFTSIIVAGTLFTFEIQRLLTETPAVQTILNTLLSGIILLVSVVVSVNSIVLSHDIASIEDQEERIEGVAEFRHELASLADYKSHPSDPASFLDLMSDVITERAEAVKEVAEGGDEEFAEEIQEYIESMSETVESVSGPFETKSGAEFSVIWLGLEADYGGHVDRTRAIRHSYEEALSESVEERLEELVEAFQLFATGKEYFKTLYYTKEVSQLSQTLLAVALPAILVNALAILAINANLVPNTWLLGLPPLLSFVAAVFTVALAPFIVLTSFMIRLATVARQTAAAGPFTVEP